MIVVIGSPSNGNVKPAATRSPRTSTTSTAATAGPKGDYWKKNNERRDSDQSKAYYQRNDRWQSRGTHPHAPPKLTPSQRKARGPLPDWDDVQDGEDNFDYMNLMDAQYAQYYQMAALPAMEMSGMDPHTASMMIQQAQQHMAAFGYRPPIPLMPTHLVAPTVENREQTSPMTAPLLSPQSLMSPTGGDAINTAIPFAPIYPSQPQYVPLSDDTLKDCVRKQMWVKRFDSYSIVYVFLFRKFGIDNIPILPIF